MKKSLIALALGQALITSPAFAHSDNMLAGNVKPILADSHAPIGVMGDHLHKEGEWMVSYRLMSMSMEDNLQGDDGISTDEILAQPAHDFSNGMPMRVVPIEMTTTMHMLGAMYAPSDDLTLMLMLNYIEKEMDHETYNMMDPSIQLGTFTTKTSGIGDTKLSALYRLHEDDTHNFHWNLGLSIPTGDIDHEDSVLTPMMDGTRMTMRLPYAMQLGSGTYDVMPGVTYNGKSDMYAWGAQWMSTFRTGENDEDYTLGDQRQLSAWGSVRLHDSFSVSGRLTWRKTEVIDGDDAEIRAPVQTANPANYGGRVLNAGIGFNWVGQEGLLRGHRLAFEYEQPIQQKVNGIQMEMQNMITLGYQKAF